MLSLRLNCKRLCISLFFCATVTIASAQTFTTLHNFDGKHGAMPVAGLVQGTDGNFYGTTPTGGINGMTNDSGTVFRITPGGTFQMLYSFGSQSGCCLTAGLIQATDGNLYGTTQGEGLNPGTIFKIAMNGKFTKIYTFCSQPGCADGSGSGAGLIQVADGNLYGTTRSTVFKITLGGTLTTLYTFGSQPGDGLGGLGLIQATDGNFYGTTLTGGTNNSCEFGGCGTVFKITPTGKFTTLYDFCSQSGCADGSAPHGGLVQTSDGNLYGTTAGSASGGIGAGSVFKITPSGTLTTLHDFCDCHGDGSSPDAGLIQATDGNLYGTTVGGGTLGNGTVFKITPSGTFTIVYSFGSQTGDGTNPEALLMQSTNGNFYGTTTMQGAHVYGVGTVFSASVGLGPFVETQTTSGKVGAFVKILGTDLTGATSVSFNGIAATFEASNSLITTNVPAGATTGNVTVATPSGTLTSNLPFRVTPQFLSFSPPSGPVGTPVTITGVSLTQTTSVAFDGVPATIFSVDSDTQVTATVPTGAKTGPIVITTAGGKALSPGAYTVTQ